MLPRLSITIERWKYNSEYGVYVSNLGNIKSGKGLFKKKLRYLVQKGYEKIVINRKMIPVHRLVLSTWRPVHIMDSLTVDHVNGNRRDNRLINLEWVSEQENLERAKNKERAHCKLISGIAIRSDKFEAKKYDSTSLNLDIKIAELDKTILWLNSLGILNFKPEQFKERVKGIITRGNLCVKYCGMVITPLY